MESCRQHLQQDAIAIFIKYRDAKNGEQDKLWQKFYSGPFKEIDFIDPALLKAHAMHLTQENLTKSLSYYQARIKAAPLTREQCSAFEKDIANYRAKSQ